MKKAKKGLLTFVLALLCAVLLFIVGSHYFVLHPRTPERELVLDGDPTQPMPTQQPEIPPEDGPEPQPLPTGETISARLTVAGDMVIHDGLNAEARLEDGYDYRPIFEGVRDYVRDADFAVSTLETTFAGTAEFTGYPLFKSPDALAWSLGDMGFDLINTASNHCMDAYKGGLFRTLDVLEEHGMQHVGTYRSQEERSAQNGITMADVGGIRVAFLAYSYGTNGIPVEDNPYVVNLFYKNYITSLSDINYEMIETDMAAARECGADLIAVFMHWGLEYQTTPSADQNALADFLFQQGADLILGGHTHVPQPMELRQVTDLSGREKTGYICYCLGNLVSCQVDLNTNLTALVNIDLEKDTGSGVTVVKSVSYVPMYMMNLYDYGVTNAGWRYRLLNIHEAMAAYEDGSSDFLTESMYRSLKEGLETIHRIMGEEFDAGRSPAQ